jgi:hypothetical protein
VPFYPAADRDVQAVAAASSSAASRSRRSRVQAGGPGGSHRRRRLPAATRGLAIPAAGDWLVSGAWPAASTIVPTPRTCAVPGPYLGQVLMAELSAAHVPAMLTATSG